MKKYLSGLKNFDLRAIATSGRLPLIWIRSGSMLLISIRHSQSVPDWKIGYAPYGDLPAPVGRFTTPQVGTWPPSTAAAGRDPDPPVAIRSGDLKHALSTCLDPTIFVTAQIVSCLTIWQA